MAKIMDVVIVIRLLALVDDAGISLLLETLILEPVTLPLLLLDVGPLEIVEPLIVLLVV